MIELEFWPANGVDLDYFPIPDCNLPIRWMRMPCAPAVGDTWEHDGHEFTVVSRAWDLNEAGLPRCCVNVRPA